METIVHVDISGFKKQERQSDSYLLAFLTERSVGHTRQLIGHISHVTYEYRSRQR